MNREMLKEWCEKLSTFLRFNEQGHFNTKSKWPCNRGIEKLYFNLYVFCLESNLPNIIIAIQNRHTNSFTNSMLENFCNLLKILHPDICIFWSNGICLTFNCQCDTTIFKSDFHKPPFFGLGLNLPTNLHKHQQNLDTRLLGNNQFAQTLLPVQVKGNQDCQTIHRTFEN